jgi:tetratricopeptide (TPR) repeat protein
MTLNLGERRMYETFKARAGRTRALGALVILALSVGGVSAADSNGARPFSKDVGPANAACDGLEKGSSTWTTCVGKASVALQGDEAFYAGYWLAKSGKYAEALDYLRLASQTDARVLTYIGFVTRKLGDLDGAFPYYDKALSLNPNYVVARAYLGEAYLSCDNPEKAEAQLQEIAARCGASCAEHADLAVQLVGYKNRSSRSQPHKHRCSKAA